MSITTPETNQDQGPKYYSGANAAEVERLRRMADIADGFSTSLIHDCRYILMPPAQDGAVNILDVGSGDSTKLGEMLTLDGFDYRATDSRPEAVAAQIAAGHNAQCEPVGSPTTAPDSVDIVHSRFVLAWLNGARRSLFEDAFYVGKQNFGIVCIDYDWSTLKGPKPLLELGQLLMTTLSARGYDGNYGQVSREETNEMITLMATDKNQNSVYVSEQKREPVYVGPLEGGKQFFENHITPVVYALKNSGYDDQAQEIEEKYRVLCEYIKSHPNEHVYLPDMVGFFIVAKNKQELLDPEVSLKIKLGRQPLRQEAMIEGQDYDPLFASESALGKVVLAKNPGLILQARITQGAAYRGKNRVRDNALNLDGTLKPHIVPDDQIARTRYVVVCGNQRMVDATIGMLCQNEGGVLSLPIIQKLQGSKDPEIREFLNNHSALFDPKTTEAVGYGVHPSATDHYAGSRALLGFSQLAALEGRSFAVMGIVEDTAQYLTGLYGDAFKRIGTETFSVNAEDVNDSVRLVPFVVDAIKFPEAICSHLSELQDNRVKAGKSRVAVYDHVMDDARAVILARR